MLNKNEFEAVPIGKDYQPKMNYKFEEMDTKGDLMEIMREDFERGILPPEEYSREFFDKFP